MNYVSLRHYDKVEKGLRNFHSRRAYIAIKTLKKGLTTTGKKHLRHRGSSTE